MIGQILQGLLCVVLDDFKIEDLLDLGEVDEHVVVVEVSVHVLVLLQMYQTHDKPPTDQFDLLLRDESLLD